MGVQPKKWWNCSPCSSIDFEDRELSAVKERGSRFLVANNFGLQPSLETTLTQSLNSWTQPEANTQSCGRQAFKCGLLISNGHSAVPISPTTNRITLALWEGTFSKEMHASSWYLAFLPVIMLTREVGRTNGMRLCPCGRMFAFCAPFLPMLEELGLPRGKERHGIWDQEPSPHALPSPGGPHARASTHTLESHGFVGKRSPLTQIMRLPT